MRAALRRSAFPHVAHASDSRRANRFHAGPRRRRVAGEAGGARMGDEWNLGGVASATVLADGAPLPDAMQIETISTRAALNEPSTARIGLAPRDPDDDAAMMLRAGATIQIRLGYDGADERLVFSGRIVREHVRLGAQGVALSVTATDAPLAASHGALERRFTEMTDADVMRALLAEAGMECVVADTAETRRVHTLSGRSIWAVVARLAAENGFVIAMRDGAAHIGAPEFGAIAATATVGESLISASLTRSAARQPAQVEARSFTVETGAMESAIGAEPDIPYLGDMSGAMLADRAGAGSARLSAPAGASAATRAQLADAALLHARLDAMRGSIAVPGAPGLSPGDVVAVKGFGRRIDGEGALRGVRHALRAGRFTSTLAFGAPRMGEPVDAPELALAVSAATGAAAFRSGDEAAEAVSLNVGALSLGGWGGALTLGGGDASISAEARAALSGAMVSATAEGDVAISGANVRVNAQMSGSLEGGASASLKSGGTAEVTGSLVRIN